MTDEQKVKPSLVPLALELENYLQHNLDIITDSDWFEQLVEEKVKKILQEREDDYLKRQSI
tara:strand:+ start:441 stop:623 length:183 start_codon:yes stop_codon:yes gene_type:complete